MESNPELDLIAERISHEITRDRLTETLRALKEAQDDRSRVYEAFDNATMRNRQTNANWFCVGFMVCGIAVAVLFLTVRLSQ